jgi:hypothetical protein
VDASQLCSSLGPSISGQPVTAEFLVRCCNQIQGATGTLAVTFFSRAASAYSNRHVAAPFTK